MSPIVSLYINPIKLLYMNQVPKDLYRLASDEHKSLRQSRFISSSSLTRVKKETLLYTIIIITLLCLARNGVPCIPSGARVAQVRLIVESLNLVSALNPLQSKALVSVPSNVA